MTRELFAALVIASTTIAAGAPALAAQQTAPITLKTSDLDLTTADGQRVAQERVAATAQTACSANMVGSRLAQVDRDCLKDVTQRLKDGLAVRTQQAAKASAVKTAGAAGLPKAVDQPER